MVLFDFYPHGFDALAYAVLAALAAEQLLWWLTIARMRGTRAVLSGLMSAFGLFIAPVLLMVISLWLLVDSGAPHRLLYWVPRVLGACLLLPIVAHYLWRYSLRNRSDRGRER